MSAQPRNDPQPSTAAERAAARRTEWRGEVVIDHKSKGPLYQDLSPTERLRAFAELNRRVWSWTESQTTQRSQWTSADYEVIPAGTTRTTPAP